MIPLSVPNIEGNEWQYIKECLDTNWVSSVGSYVDLFEQKVAEFTGAQYAVSTVNGTAALHIALLLSNVTQDDCVLVPNITFIASVNAIKYVNASPIFIDIDPDTWQMDLGLLEEFLENETTLQEGICTEKNSQRKIKAIMPVHVLGNMADMDHLKALAKKFHLEIIEDASEALGSYYEGTHSGNFGKFGCFSFNGNKIITTGGGGIIITDDEQLAAKAKHITTQAKADKFEYVHDHVGYNYRLVNVLAAMGVAQMENLPKFLNRKQEVNAFYREQLTNVGDIQLQEIPNKTSSNHWLFTILTSQQKPLIQHLTAHKIQVRPLWYPMNRLEMFKHERYYSRNDLSMEVYQKSISLPCSTNISEEDTAFVVKTIRDFFN
ncbi:MAG TPA: hypothetical protein DCS93_44250 [Microscillaceae bacterium]|nr:hypothetical protein [Microscillaceae bacterium]